MTEEQKLYDGAVIKPDGTVSPPARRATDLPPDAPWWARYLEANAKQAWRYAAHAADAGVIALATAYAEYPQETVAAIEKMIPASYWPYLVGLLCLGRIIVRSGSAKLSTPEGSKQT